MKSPLATQEQCEIESLAMKLFQNSEVRAARERLRPQLLADPVAKTPDGFKGLDRALDQWTLALCMRYANSDVFRPKLVWNVDNTPRTWFGHTYPGAAVAVDNPDNINREAPIDGDQAYELTGQYSKLPTQLTLMLETAPQDQGGLGRNISTLTTQQIKTAPDGSFVITLDSQPGQGRVNHLQTESGRLNFFARDSHADWRQIPTTLALQRVSKSVAPRLRTLAELASATAESLPGFVTPWQRHKDSLLGFPTFNQLIGPEGRIGGWGFLAGGRFRLADDEGLLITINDGGALYTGFQISDPWTMTPDPIHHTCSLNKAQSARNPDNSFTYVISARDPSLCNWINTVGLREGWFLLRWQGIAADTPPDTLVREVRCVKLSDLDAYCPDTPTASLSFRSKQIEMRVRDHSARIRDSDG